MSNAQLKRLLIRGGDNRIAQRSLSANTQRANCAHRRPICQNLLHENLDGRIGEQNAGCKHAIAFSVGVAQCKRPIPVEIVNESR